uniref:Uncharacterized protein n=1 Tax=Zea mays TaxID=4577 RepID=A0A804RJ44_MAIZE
MTLPACWLADIGAAGRAAGGGPWTARACKSGDAWRAAAAAHAHVAARTGCMRARSARGSTLSRVHGTDPPTHPSSPVCHARDRRRLSLTSSRVDDELAAPAASWPHAVRWQQVAGSEPPRAALPREYKYPALLYRARNSLAIDPLIDRTDARLRSRP